MRPRADWRAGSPLASVGFAFGLLLLLSTTRPGAFAAEAANTLSDQEKKDGWQLLFDGRTLAGWHSYHKQSYPTNGWDVQAGWLHCLGTTGGDLFSDHSFDHFELKWEWRQVRGGNSGVKYFVNEAGNDPRGHEYQMIDDAANEDAKLAQGKRVTASFYDVLAPLEGHVRPAGETNQGRVLVRGNHVEHWLNGAKVLEYECDSDALKAAIAQSKFKNTSGFASVRNAPLLLQDHHSEVWFRNLKIRVLAE